MATPTIGPSPGELNLRIRQGSTFAPPALIYFDPDGEPIDLTGFTARAQLRDPGDLSVLFLTLTTENGGIVLGDDAGTIALFISAEDTADMSFDAAVWDLDLINGSVIDTLLTGAVELTREITRAP